MNLFKKGAAATMTLAALACISLSASAASADPMPRGAKPASYNQLIRLYSGKTDLWIDNCNGGIYYGGGSQARAWCANSPENLGAGNWSVGAGGQVCYQLTWYYPSGNRAGSSQGERTCLSHVVDRGGNIWRKWPGSPEWWPAKGSTLERGYRFQQNVLQTRRRLGF